MERQEFNEIVDGDGEDYLHVNSVTIEDQSRWSIYKSVVVQQFSTGKFFKCYWGEGATEIQDGQDEMWSINEVESYTVSETKWRPVKDGILIEGSC